MEENKNIEQESPQPEVSLRSDEVQEIMSSVPNWMIRWGITLIFGLIVMFLFISFIIKYPDAISGTVTLNTSNPPIKLVSKANAELSLINFENNTQIEKGDVICVLNNLLSLESRNELNKEIALIDSLLKNNQINTYKISNTLNLGALQATYINVNNAVAKYRNVTEENNIEFRIQNLKDQIKNHTILRSVTYQQLNTSKKQLVNAQEKFNAQKQLYEKSIISKNQFFEEQTLLINAENAVENNKKSAVQHSITLTDLAKQLNDIEFQFTKEKKEFLNEIQNQLSLLKNEVVNWDLNYSIISPINGRLTYLNTFSENQYIEAGKELFAVVAKDENYVGFIKIPKAGFGKVKLGQKVRIKLDNFPSHEYGQVNALVKEISLLPEEETYLVKIELTNGLISSYNQELRFTPEMSGTAEIITEDLRLLERIFNQFRSIFKD